MKNFDDDIIDFINTALDAKIAGQTTDASTVTMPHSMFIRFVTQAQEYQHAALQYQAFHETEKAMRRFAEEDLGKFRKLIGRIFWMKK
jgi:hypothetical protein